MTHQYVSNTGSTVDVVAADLLTASALPQGDYIVRLETDLNLMWDALEIPNRPVTDDNGVVDVLQDAIVGSPVADFHTALNTYKTTWGSAPAVGTALTFQQVMSYVVRYILDPSVTSLLDPDCNIITQDGVRFNIDPAKVNLWLQATGDPNPNDFYTLVFTEAQIDNILQQIRNTQEYNQVNGKVALQDGSEIGILVKLRTSAANEFDLHLFIRQLTTPP